MNEGTEYDHDNGHGHDLTKKTKTTPHVRRSNPTRRRPTERERENREQEQTQKSKKDSYKKSDMIGFKLSSSIGANNMSNTGMQVWTPGMHVSRMHPLNH
jgi:hypothetical protein